MMTASIRLHGYNAKQQLFVPFMGNDVDYCSLNIYSTVRFTDCLFQENKSAQLTHMFYSVYLVTFRPLLRQLRGWAHSPREERNNRPILFLGGDLRARKSYVVGLRMCWSSPSVVHIIFSLPVLSPCGFSNSIQRHFHRHAIIFSAHHDWGTLVSFSSLEWSGWCRLLVTLLGFGRLWDDPSRNPFENVLF